MVYDKSTRCYGDGRWHCPFPKSWVNRKKQAAKICKMLTAEQIDAAINREVHYIELPKLNFLRYPQDARGLPVSLTERNVRSDYRLEIYDYKSIPDVVISNGIDDWPLPMRRATITA
jgi:hypothetical protein